MSPTLILFPVFALVALTFGLLVRMGRARVASVKTGATRLKDIALGQSAWPAPVMAIDRSFHNQFELPVLFYALAAFILVTRQFDVVQLVLAWVFVALRYAHAYVHVATNHVPTRFNLFLAGLVTLGVMWLVFAVRITMALV